MIRCERGHQAGVVINGKDVTTDCNEMRRYANGLKRNRQVSLPRCMQV